MNKKVIIQPSDPKQFGSIEEYLLHTYGEKKLTESLSDSNSTFHDVIGYTLEKNGLETIEGAYYELEDIEDMMSEVNEDYDLDQEKECQEE